MGRYGPTWFAHPVVPSHSVDRFVAVCAVPETGLRFAAVYVVLETEHSILVLTDLVEAVETGPTVGWTPVLLARLP